MIRRAIGRLAAAVLVTAAAVLAVPSAPARAAYCSGGAGVSVLVDYAGLGGGTSTGCGSGATADRAFTSAGFSLRQHPRQQGFVCQVNGKPADGNCLGTDAYWGFFVSDDGKGWVYASMGVYQQAVDAGDSVALVWQSEANKKVMPGTGPAAAQPTPTRTATAEPRPTRRPKPRPTKHVDLPANPSTSATAGPVRSSGSATPTATPTPRSSATQKATPSPAPSATGATSAGPSTAPTSTGAAAGAVSSEPSPSASATSSTTAATEPTASDSGLPGWVPPLLVAVLALAAGGVAWVRRTR